jgi:hypothetical protein
MDVIQVVNVLKLKFNRLGHPVQIPLLKGDHFVAEMTDDGIKVDNLGTQPHLPWAVFQETICVLIQNNGRAERGDAMGSKLGDAGLPLDSVEGHIAQVVYGKRRGDTVFRRITPIACILVWAGICDTAPHELILRDFSHG